MREEKTTRPVRLFWPLLLGLGLALALLWGLTPRSAVEAQTVNSGFTVDLVHDRVKIAPRGAYGAAQADASVLLETPPVWTNALDATPPAPWRDDPIRATVSRSAATARAGRATYASLAPSPAITILLTNDAVWGFVTANRKVSVTLGDDSGLKGQGFMRSDAVGYFYVQPYDDGSVADIAGGDTVTVTVGGITTVIVSVPAITVTVNAGVDVVSATISGSTPGFDLKLAALGREQAIVAVGDGTYSADFSTTSDLTHWDTGSALYTDAAGNSIVADGWSQDSMIVNETYNYVDGYTSPGSVVTVTHDQAGSIVSSTVTANNSTGRWSWSSPAISAGDVITVELGETVISTTVSLITGSVDVSANTVAGAGPTASSITARLWRNGVRHDYIVATDPSDGSYTATFSPEGIRNGETVYLYHHDNAAADTLVYAREPYILLVLNWNEVDAFIGQEGVAVTATLRNSAGGVKEQQTGTSTSAGWFWTRFDESMKPGDIVGVIGGTLSDTVTVVTLTLSLDVDANTMSGLAPANADLDLRLYRDNRNFGQTGLYTSTALGDGTFSFNAGDFQDIHNSIYSYVYVRQNNDLDDHQIARYDPSAHLIADETQNGASCNVPDSNAPVTMTLLAADNSVKSVRTQTSDGSGWVPWTNFDTDVIATDKVRFESPSFSQTVTVLSMTANIDAGTDRVTGVGPPNSFLVIQFLYAWPPLVVPTDGAGNYVADFAAVGIDFGPNDRVTVDAFDENWNVSRIVGRVPYARVNDEWNSVDGWFGPDVTVNFTVTDALGAYKGSGSGATRSDGWLNGRGCGCDIAPTDLISVTSDVGFATMMEMITITGQVGVVSDVVSGQMMGGIFPASGNIWLWSDTRQDGYGTSISIDAGGFYTADLGVFDIWDGDHAEVWYYDSNGNHIGNTLFAPILRMRVNYGHDWVEGNYEAGHTMWLTVTESDGFTVKATAELTTGVVPWWGGQTGFSTNWQGWSPGPPDIEAGDWVYGLVDDGKSASVRIGVINGEVDVEADTISGTIHANWFTQTLNANCGVWEENGPGQGFSVDPDGGAYLCDFSAEWDLLPGHQVGVQYQEPDGDWVINVFQEPQPYLRVEKSANSNPGEGGNFSFNIQYWNDGSHNDYAENVVISDTLLGGMTYITDTSGFTRTGSGTPLVWELGTLPGNSSGQFDVFVEVTALENDTITNTVQITTSSPYNQSSSEERYSEWNGTVQANDTWLSVGKWVDGPNPAPSTDFNWIVNVCNDGNTSSSELTLTDTLPISTTLLEWWGQNPGWSEALNTSEQLVLSYPSVPSRWCGQVYLRFHLDEDAWIGMQISNTATISASNDLNGGSTTTDWRWISGPYSNLYVRKGWLHGQLSPGGELPYQVQYGNDGNAPADDVLITYTLPASTTFDNAWQWDQYGHQYPFIPATVTADQVVWDLGTLENGENSNFEMRLDVDSGASPGTLLNSAIEITPHPSDYHHDDNIVAWVETLNSSGPNLEVHKQHYWWNGNNQLNYEIRIKNRGDERMEPVWITDTYPISTTWNGDYHIGHGPWITDSHDAPDRQIIFWLQSLDPGESASIQFWVELDGSIHGTQGLFFTNTLSAPMSGDVYPADNEDEVVAYAGPDVYAQKWLREGEPRPGNTVTFTVKFGNRNGWQGMDGGFGSYVTDTLPVEMAFITATTPWDPNQHWFPDGITGTTSVRWSSGTPWPNSTYYFAVVAQITDTLEGGDVITNVIQIHDGNPGNLDLSSENDVFELPIVILNPKFEIGKVYEGQAAGATVSYTLTITNVGSDTGSGVIVTDTIPAHLTDVSVAGGTLDPSGWIEWLLGPIAPGGGTATASFSATLPCTAGLSIVNDDYGVRGSDQGVSGPAGAALSFDIIAPTINASFSQSASSIIEGETVTFTGTATTNGAPLSYAWDFGDGGAGAGLNASHTFTQTGDYTVTSTVTDSCGYSAQATGSVHVAPSCVNVTGLSFDYAPASPVIQSAVVFNASVTGGDTPITYAWDLGDGSSSGPVVNHTYALSDTFTVAVTATNCAGDGVMAYTEDVDVILTDDHRQADVDPEMGATLVYTDSQGNATVIEVPGGVVSESVTLLYTALASPSEPISSSLRFANHAFNLDAYRGYELLTDFTFSPPATITVNYLGSGTVGMVEPSLKLYYWTGSTWDDVAKTCTPESTYTRNQAQHWLRVAICHLSEIGLFGKSQYQLYLPVVLRDSGQ